MPTATAAPTPEPTKTSITPTEPEAITVDTTPRDIGGKLLFDWSQAGPGFEYEPSTVEELLEKGTLPDLVGSLVHIALRGAPVEDSVRCEWHGFARTLEQREGELRFRLELDDGDPLPPVAEMESFFEATSSQLMPRYREGMRAAARALIRGGHSTDYQYLACYIDFLVGEYLLGAGPNRLTVAYDMSDIEAPLSYGLYFRTHQAGGYLPDEPLMTREEYQTSVFDRPARNAESLLRDSVVGRDSVLFLSPMGAQGNVAIEVWQVIAQWDIQQSNEELDAVRYNLHEDHPEYRQTLPNLKSRIATAAASDAFARKRIASTEGLNQFYRDIGAYGDITPDDGNADTFTPAQPPPVRDN